MMKVAFYRELPSGNVIHHSFTPNLENFSEEEIRESKRNFNRAYEGVREVEIIEVEPGSVIAYLLRKSAAATTYTQESINDALAAIRGAEQAILDLQVKKEEE